MLDGDNPAGGLMGRAGKREGCWYCSVRQVPPPRGSPVCTRRPADGKTERYVFGSTAWKQWKAAKDRGVRGRAWVASQFCCVCVCVDAAGQDGRETACPSTKHCPSVSVCATRLARLRRRHSNEGTARPPSPPPRCRVSTLTVEAPPPHPSPGRVRPQLSTPGR